MDLTAEDETFLSKICFRNKKTFHLSLKVNRHNIRIWGSKNPHTVAEHLRNRPQMNYFGNLGCEKCQNIFLLGGGGDN
jgi:hypothetical protein